MDPSEARERVGEVFIPRRGQDLKIEEERSLALAWEPQVFGITSPLWARRESLDGWKDEGVDFESSGVI